MATYDLAYPGAAIDAILNTAYFLQEAGYIFQGSASEYSGTPSKRVWLIAPAGFTGLGLSSAVPQGSIGVCLYNGTAWVGKVINVVTIDNYPTYSSTNAVTSGGMWNALDDLGDGIRATLQSFVIQDGTASANQGTQIKFDVKMTDGQQVQHLISSFGILAATTTKAGLMSAADKAKVDAFLANLRSLTFTDTTASADQATQITETLKATIGGVQEVIDSITLLAATSSKAGLLSASDKAYIDALPATLTSLSNSISGALALMQSLVGYYTCDTAAGTAAKTVAATGYSLTNGGCIRIKMTNANTAANVTLNINSTGAKALYYDGAQASSTNTWEAGEVLEVYYDGTQYQCAFSQSLADIDDIFDAIDENKTYLEQLGSACENQGGTVEETLYGEVGVWSPDGTITTSRLIRAHLKIPAIGVNAMSITVPSGYYANIYYVNASNVMQSAVLVDWQGVGTVNLELKGAFDLMLNIKYGSAGTTNITSDMLASAPFVVTKSVMSGYNPAAPLSRLEETEENIAPLIIKTKDYDSWDNSGNPQNIRVRFIYTGIAGATVKVVANGGYSFGIAVYSTDTPTGTAVYDTGWQTGSYEYTVPSTGIGCMTINTAKGNRTVRISYDESVANISRSVVLGTRSVIDDAIKDSQDIITSGAVYASMYGKGSYQYSGQRVVLAPYNFQGLEFMTVAAPSGTGQGAGVYGDYFVQGGAGGRVRVYNLATKAVVANSVNLAVVDSTNHVNNICFSKLFPDGNTDFPYMYVSECTGQERCFVENFKTSGSTLVQTLSYSGTDLHDTNWALDYDSGYIYLLGNTESSYTVANNKVRVKKLALPLPTAGDVVFTPEDVLDTFDMDGSDGQARVMQGNIISNGKMYSCFGGAYTTHRIWINDLDTHELLTVIELDQMYTGECESINIWNNSLLIGYPNQSKLYQLTF